MIPPLAAAAKGIVVSVAEAVAICVLLVMIDGRMTEFMMTIGVGGAAIADVVTRGAYAVFVPVMAGIAIPVVIVGTHHCVHAGHGLCLHRTGMSVAAERKWKSKDCCRRNLSCSH